MKVAVVGATGAVGREILRVLAERSFPAHEVVALASDRSKGKEVSFGDEKILKIIGLKEYDFEGTDIALFAAGGECAKEFAPKAVKAGTRVIDNSSYFRMEAHVPLIVPEVNGEKLPAWEKPAIIANPNCVAIPLVMALKPLQEAVGVKRVVVSTYQSTSGKGRLAMDELFRQTKAVLVGDALGREVFPKPIAFNVFPHVDSFRADGSTFEEWKVRVETSKILGEEIPVAVTCVRVPVFVGHSLAVTVELNTACSVAEARKHLKKMPGVMVVDNLDEENYMTPTEAAGEDAVFISRLRQDPTVEQGLQMWVVSDNLRKGAALNAVQIAESLLALRKPKLKAKN